MTFVVSPQGEYLCARWSSSGVDLLAETQAAYERFFSLRTREHRYLVKCHNSIPDLLRDRRYDAFNLARQQAFTAAEYAHHPAACAVGAPLGARLELGCLLGPELPRELENPRQLAAYDYPALYGPAPLFARAVNDRGRLYVSGTASIVGHESRHPGEVRGQLAETLENLHALLDPLGVSFGALRFVVYVKSADLISVIRKLFAAPASYVVCDLCRPELLVEIEATSNHAVQLTSLHA